MADLESLNQIIDFCESSLFTLRTATNEWKTEATSEMDIRQKKLKEHKNNLKSSFEATAESVKGLLNKQKEKLEEFHNIASESLNAESTSRKIVIDKIQAVEQAISSLDSYCTEVNENEVDKTNMAHSSMKNYLELGREVVENLANYAENSSKNIDDMQTEAVDHISDMFSQKRKTLKDEEHSAFSRYKNLTEELESLSKTDKNFCGIRDSVRRFIQDIDDSNEQLKVSKSIQAMVDSVIKRGNSFVTRMYTNYTNVESSLSNDKLNMEALVKSSKQLSKIADSEISNYHEFLKNDLLKRFSEKISEVNITRSEASFSGTNTIVSDRTLCATNAATELILQPQDSVSEIECSMCLKNMDQTLQTDNSILLPFSRDPLKYKISEVPGSSKSFMSESVYSPVRRPRSKNSMARKNLLFPDVEKLANELLENTHEDGS